jgi:hypothetical protein
MELKLEKFLNQLNWKIKSTEKSLADAKRDLINRVAEENYYMIDTRTVEKIKVLTEKLETLQNQKDEFIYTFEIEIKE